MDHPLQPLTMAWINKIKQALVSKKERFQDAADEALQFYNGPYDFLYNRDYSTKSKGFVYSGDDAGYPQMAFGLTVNKVAEIVQLFGPVLYHRNPNRQVTPRELPMLPLEALLGPDPMQAQMQQQAQMQAQMRQQQVQAVQQQMQQMQGIDQARATLLQHYLNYTPLALDLKTESRWAVDEALIKGLGLLWCQTYTPPGSQRQLVGSFWDTCDNLVIDPDMESFRDIKWIAQRCTKPVWEVAQEYGIDPDDIKGSFESYNRQAEVAAEPGGETYRRMGMTNDLFVYWKVWSKMGVGGRLAGQDKAQAPALDALGTYCYLVVCDGMPYPLNLPPALIETQDLEQVRKKLEWPTPFWADDAWPFTPLSFHWIPRQAWPQSHVASGLGELKAIQWVYSFIVNKIRIASRDFIAVIETAGEDILQAIQHGTDYEIIKLKQAHGRSINDLVSFLQHPPFQGDIWKVLQAMETNFEKRMGLPELRYGRSGPTQERSASEVNIKADMASVRPDDMANKVEDFMAEVARKEALCARWHLDGQDVAPILGPIGAQWWEQLVAPSDPSELLHQLEYRIESGSVRKPNRDRDAGNMQNAMQTLFAPLFQLAMQTGQVQPVNALISAWGKTIDLDVSGLLIQPPPPPPPQGPTPEQMQAEHEQGVAQRDTEHQQGVAHAEEQHQQAIRMQAEKHMQAMQAAADKAKAQKAAQQNGAK